jgi:hypothetical protein
LIESRKISFCIQGPVYFDSRGNNATQQLVDSIKKHYPQSPIHFASWLDQKDNLPYGLNSHVLLGDPGSGPRYLDRLETNNINRQITSTQAALNLADTDFAVKIRSDLIIKNNFLLKILGRLPNTPNHKLGWFQKYVVFTDRLTMHPEGPAAIPMHPSDYFQAGLLSDIRDYWSVPQISESDEYFYLQNQDQLSSENGLIHVPRWRAETYFWAHFVWRNSGQQLPEFDTREKQLLIGTRDVFANNIIPMKSITLGLDSQKHSWGIELVTHTYAYTFFDWMADTRKLGVELRNIPIGAWEYIGWLYKICARLARHSINKVYRWLRLG